MYNLSDSPFFTPWTNPETGITLYLLTRKVAPVQEAFYFVNSSFSANGRYLWFYCAFPPSGTAGQGRTLAVLDFERGEITPFPETQFNHVTPMVDPASGRVFWGMGSAVWTRGPEPSDSVDLVGEIPADLIGSRIVERIATHLTRSADGAEFFLDAAIGLQFIFGTIPSTGGDFSFWHRFDRNYNHAQFSPTDPNAVLFAQENHPDPLTGLTFPITNRLWLIRRGQGTPPRPAGSKGGLPPRPLLPEPRKVTHEWWDASGAFAWCVTGNEAWRVAVDTGQVEAVPFPNHVWHAHATRDNACLIADTNERFYRGCASGVGFLNRATGRYVKLVDNPEMHNYIGRTYHIDPHPRFCVGDEVVVFTTTLRGEVDLAVAYTRDLIERTT